MRPREYGGIQQPARRPRRVTLAHKNTQTRPLGGGHSCVRADVVAAVVRADVVAAVPRLSCRDQLQNGAGCSPRAAVRRALAKRTLTGSEASNQSTVPRSWTFISKSCGQLGPRTSVFNGVA